MPREGQSEEVERQVGQAEGKLFTHRAAFARTSVIQAFLGSAPQLTLQLYICVVQRGVSIGRGEDSVGQSDEAASLYADIESRTWLIFWFLGHNIPEGSSGGGLKLGQPANTLIRAKPKD